MEVYRSDYQVITHISDLSLLEAVWLPESKNMGEEDYKIELRKQVELVKQYGIKRELFDTKNFAFAITPELQAWTDEEIYSAKHELGVVQFALVVSEEMISQLSLEQAMEEGKAHEFKPRFFTSAQEAKEWFKNN